jgi:hypothetical protein
MIVVYVWCDCGTPGTRGHYYTRTHCPFSGWVAPYVKEVQEAVARLEATGKPLTIAGLRDAGVSPEALKRVLIAEYAAGAEVPEALGVDSFGE